MPKAQIGNHCKNTVNDIDMTRVSMTKPKSVERRKFYNDETCPIRNVVAQIGDKWSMLILFALVDGADRFNSLKSRILGISQRMLTQTLRDLEREGYVKRTVYPEVPARVEYELTEMGRGIVKPLYQLVVWAGDHHDEIKNSRDVYDNKNGA